MTLYGGPAYGGMSRTFSQSSANLAQHHFNDRAQSVRVARGGRWLLCENANYRGRCIVVTHSISDLRRHGLSRSVSSIRRQ